MRNSGTSRRRIPIDSKIKSALGYSPTASDDDVLGDWTERKRRVCKPCWELRYCPYGPLVEQSPLLPSLRAEQSEHNDRLRSALESGQTGSVQVLTPELRKQYQEWIDDEELRLQQAWNLIREEARLDSAWEQKTDDEKINAFLQLGALPPIHLYRVPFELGFRELQETEFETKLWTQIADRAEQLRRQYEEYISSGEEDTRRTLHPVRRLWFEQTVQAFDPDIYPESIPETFSEASCSIFGHICPVFFSAEGLTEKTQEQRQLSP